MDQVLGTVMAKEIDEITSVVTSRLGHPPSPCSALDKIAKSRSIYTIARGSSGRRERMKIRRDDGPRGRRRGGATSRDDARATRGSAGASTCDQTWRGTAAIVFGEK